MTRQHQEQSSRSITRDTGIFVRTTPGSQSLERGLLILRTFRHGVDLLTNSEIADRTCLARPTVSRLCRSLVESGFLEYDSKRKAYQLSIVCLSLSLSFRSSEPALELALPVMRELAQVRHVNVGIATADLHEMVYLESVRFSRRGIFRRILTGTRIPIPATSLGCAFLAGLDRVKRDALLHQLEVEHAADWPRFERIIQKSLRNYKIHRYCYAEWQTGSGAVAAPITSPSGRTYAVNISFPLDPEEAKDTLFTEHAQLLLNLVARIQVAWSK